MTSNKRIAINSIIIFLRLCIVSLVGIISSRLVLDALGASDYGLYNVVGGIVTLLNIVNTAMLSTTYRYIAFEVGKKDGGNPNLVFNTSLVIHVFFALFILIIGLAIGDWYINNYLQVDQGKIGDALFVFHISLITTAVSTLLVPYNGLLVAFEKFSVNAVIDIVANLLKIAAIFLFIYNDTNRLRLYSIIMMGCTFLSSISYLLYSYWHYYSIVKIRINKNKEKYVSMASYAWWTLFGSVAIIGKDQGSKVLINYFFGTIVNASYAIANQVEGFILTFARSLSSAAIPQITKSYSGGDSKRSITLTSYISKYTFLLMSLVAFPVLLDMEFLLKLWLKEVPEGTIIFCNLVVLNGLIGCLGEGIPALVNATGNIKKYQIVYQTFNFLGLPIAWLLFVLGGNQFSIIIVYCVITFLCAFVRLYLLKKLFGFNIHELINISYLKILYVSVPCFIFYLLYDPFAFSTLEHVLGFVFAELFLLTIIVFFGTDKRERQMIIQVKTKIMHK